MKEKQKPKGKNYASPLARNLLKVQKVYRAILLFIVILVFVLGFTFIGLNLWENYQFSQVRLLEIQDTVRNQCEMADYRANGTFEDSRMVSTYSDTSEDKQITCNSEGDSAWQCRCE